MSHDTNRHFRSIIGGICIALCSSGGNEAWASEQSEISNEDTRSVDTIQKELSEEIQKFKDLKIKIKALKKELKDAQPPDPHHASDTDTRSSEELQKDLDDAKTELQTLMDTQDTNLEKLREETTDDGKAAIQKDLDDNRTSIKGLRKKIRSLKKALKKKSA
jgi:hypothetical protein